MRNVPQRPYTDNERETITKMIADGHSSREVAERLGRTRNSVIAVSNRERLGTWKFSNNKGGCRSPV
jgi:transposase